MMITIVQAAASIAVLALAGNTGRNMVQTVSISRNDAASIDAGSKILPELSSPEAAVDKLQSLKRKELVQLFTACHAPSDLSEIAGEWNGCLLDNNGLTTISNILTHQLFGLRVGRNWNGKAFRGNGKGINRFTTKERTATEHVFEYSLQDSNIVGDSQSVRIDYWNYQSPISLWRTMRDEVRFIPGDVEVLLGMGSMGWSGGCKNCSPFCMWRTSPKN
jgi:hypothetical protein